MSALVIGASGLVGGALYRALEMDGSDVVGTARTRVSTQFRSLDITNRDQVQRCFDDVLPEAVFVPAALTNVDYCETHPEETRAQNVEPIIQIAELCARAGRLLVYYSTDYVFDGTAGPYVEDAPISPVSVYGRSKAEAESAILTSVARHLILRTSWVFGWDRGSKNFAMQLWQRLGAGETVRVAEDQISNPTLAEYLAEVTLRLVQARQEGLVNVAGHDWIDRPSFARKIAGCFLLDPGLIEPATSDELSQPARRPLQGGLDTSKLERCLGTETMSLDEALKRVRRQWRADTYQAVGPQKPNSEAETLKGEILDKVKRYYELAHQNQPFTPFKSRVNYAGRVFGAEEMQNAADAVLDFWLTLGPWGDSLERSLREFLGSAGVALVNSGSSANLTAVATLMSPLVENPLQPGDEVITPAVTFPTTLAPIVQHGLVPVLVDVELGTYNINPQLIESAISPRTRAVMVPHTLGNPVDLDVICGLARKHGLYLIEDSCDALGSEWEGRRVGTFGDLGTLSFYPAHHMTMGEGGAVIINRAKYGRIVRSIRDWGRDCWCAPGESNTCGKRFGWCLGELPDGYDHKYVYSQLGFNLKPTDLQAAVGVAQIRRLPSFIEARRRNFARLYEGLREYADALILPRWSAKANPAWFAFPITVGKGVSRRALVGWLEESNIETRELFGGNILRQPGYTRFTHRVAGPLENSDRVMRDTFFIGVYPGLTDDMLSFMLERIHDFFAQRRA